MPPSRIGRESRIGYGRDNRARVRSRNDVVPRSALGLYAVWLLLAEAATVFLSVGWGLASHAALLLTLFGHAALTSGRSRELLTTMALLPIARLLSYTVPLGFSEPIVRSAYVTVPLLLATVLAARSLGYRRSRLGVRLRSLPLQLLVAGSALPVAWFAWRHFGPPPLVTDVAAGPLWTLAALVLFIAAGEELLFRGVLQHAAVRTLGVPLGIGYPALLYGIMHVGWQSVQHVMMATLVGAYFGVVAHRSGSLVGVVLAHALVILLFIVLSSP